MIDCTLCGARFDKLSEFSVHSFGCAQAHEESEREVDESGTACTCAGAASSWVTACESCKGYPPAAPEANPEHEAIVDRLVARRESERVPGKGKPPVHLLPMHVLPEAAKVMANVSDKHPEGSYRTDPPSSHVASLIRHIAGLYVGGVLDMTARDPESGELHLSHIVTRAMMALHHGMELDTNGQV